MLNLPFIDRIWTVRGNVELDPPRTAADAFARLDPLLQDAGTKREISGDTLTYRKENPAAQDKLATFSRGTLTVVEEEGRSRLNYKLTSPALLLVFLAPLLFLAIAQATILIIDLERPTAEEKAEAEKKKKEKEKEEKEPKALNFIDQALGAPTPETLAEKKKREEKEEKEGKKKDEKHSPKPAYVFAGIFAALYIFGRWLEPFLVRRTFRKTLNGPAAQAEVTSGETAEARQAG